MVTWISEGRHTNIKATEAFLRETRQPQLSIPLSYWLSSQRVLGFWVLGLVGSFLTWSLWSPKMLHPNLAYPMKLLLLWSYHLHTSLQTPTNLWVAKQCLPKPPSCFANKKKVCALICFPFFLLFCLFLPSHDDLLLKREKLLPLCRKAWKFGLALFACVIWE